MSDLTISDYMTKSPHTIGQEQTLTRAHELMRKFSVRHLPVLHGGQLVGTVSLRDLDLTEALRDVDPDVVIVEEAMSMEPHVVGPNAPLKEVVGYLVDHGYGSAIVKEGNEVVGVFTAVDGMRCLRDLLNT